MSTENAPADVLPDDPSFRLIGLLSDLEDRQVHHLDLDLACLDADGAPVTAAVRIAPEGHGREITWTYQITTSDAPGDVMDGDGVRNALMALNTAQGQINDLGWSIIGMTASPRTG
jgi:hypothetical protein